MNKYPIVNNPLTREILNDRIVWKVIAKSNQYQKIEMHLTMRRMLSIITSSLHDEQTNMLHNTNMNDKLFDMIAKLLDKASLLLKKKHFNEKFFIDATQVFKMSSSIFSNLNNNNNNNIP
jgi:hypothetical protein